MACRQYISYLIGHFVIGRGSRLQGAAQFTMSSLLSEFINNSIPVFLLKTRSVPQDGYHEFFTSAEVKGEKYAPVFVPVLEHNLFEDGMTTFRNALREKKVNRSGEDGTYGGAIFTSQRAVEAFAKVVNEGKQLSYSHLSEFESQTCD